MVLVNGARYKGTVGYAWKERGEGSQAARWKSASTEPTSRLLRRGNFFQHLKEKRSTCLRFSFSTYFIFFILSLIDRSFVGATPTTRQRRLCRAVVESSSDFNETFFFFFVSRDLGWTLRENTVGRAGFDVQKRRRIHRFGYKGNHADGLEDYYSNCDKYGPGKPVGWESGIRYAVDF